MALEPSFVKHNWKLMERDNRNNVIYDIVSLYKQSAIFCLQKSYSFSLDDIVPH